MQSFEKLADLEPLVGHDIGVSEWISIDQRRIDLFADATADRQWIHLDPARAAKGPFGTTVAHGFLTLSLLPEMFATAIEVRDTRMGINYGLNKVRFPAPVPVGSKVRASPKVKEVTDVPGGAQCVFEVSFEREGGDKPVCVAETVVRVYTG